MRLSTIQDYFLPQPGTPEAIELGCTCRFIGHNAKLEEAGPAQSKLPIFAITTHTHDSFADMVRNAVILMIKWDGF